MANFPDAISVVLSHECDPAHPDAVDKEPNGGYAKYGLNTVAHPELVAKYGDQLQKLTLDVAKQEYQQLYWNAALASLQSQPVCNKVFDMLVNMGPKTATLLLQRACNQIAPAASAPLKADGKLTLLVVNRVNASPPDKLLPALQHESELFYRKLANLNPKQYGPYLAGWLKRAQS
jgi:lysozyme family protein